MLVIFWDISESYKAVVGRKIYGHVLFKYHFVPFLQLSAIDSALQIQTGVFDTEKDATSWKHTSYVT